MVADEDCCFDIVYVTWKESRPEIAWFRRVGQKDKLSEAQNQFKVYIRLVLSFAVQRSRP